MVEKSPPFTALRALEAASRHRSYTWAAKELKITHSAISQSIRRLEEELGTKLFERQGGSMEPSAAALELARAYSAAAGSLARSLQNVSQAPERSRLTVAMPPDFGRLWFAPRLERLSAALPDLTVEIRSHYAGLPTPEDADLILHLGAVSDPNWAAELLCPLIAVPVCSPAFAARHRLKAPRDVLRAPLLFEKSCSWEGWLRGAGLKTFRSLHGHVFDDMGMMLDAAVRGHGLAPAYGFLAEEYLRSGALVAPIDIGVHTGEGLFLVRRAGAGRSQAAERFTRWLGQEIGGAPAGGDSRVNGRIRVVSAEPAAGTLSS